MGSCRGTCGSLLNCIFMEHGMDMNHTAHINGEGANGIGRYAQGIGGYAQIVSDRVLNTPGQGG